MVKRKNALVPVLLSLLIILLPFMTVFSTAVFTPSQYDNYFTGILDEKYDRLTSIEGEKVVVVGGSSVAFGLDSEAMEEYLGRPVVNFGLYASLGTKLMLDLSLDGIGEGDIVVIAPELDAQTLSLYFSSQTTLRAIDGNFSLFFKTGNDNWFNMLGGLWEFGVEKMKLLSDGKEKPNPTGVYNSSSFNEVYLDIDYPREENIMGAYYETENLVFLEADRYGSDFLAFADYLNEYIARCEEKGASVCFSFCPINRLSLSSGSASGKEEFVNMLKENVNCSFISDIDDYIIDEGYFYDTNFHLNDAGAILRTMRLAKDIRLEYGIVGTPIGTEPQAPELPERDIRFFGEDENARFFEFVLTPDGTYAIAGLNELGKTERELTIPLGYNGYKVTTVMANAFEGGCVTRLNVTADTNLYSFATGAFSGASTLKELYMYPASAETVLPPPTFVGVASGFELHVPVGSNYTTDYYWSERGLNIVQDIVTGD